MPRVFTFAAAMLACAAAACPGAALAFDIDTVPPFKGNDTGGIIAYPLTQQADARAMANAHCGQYGKVARVQGIQRTYGGYLSFACVWVRPTLVVARVHHRPRHAVLRVKG